MVELVSICITATVKITVFERSETITVTVCAHCSTSLNVFDLILLRKDAKIINFHTKAHRSPSSVLNMYMHHRHTSPVNTTVFAQSQTSEGREINAT